MIKNTKALHMLFLLTLGAVWGGSFLFLRISAPEVGPFVVTATRIYLALPCLLVYALFIKRISLRNLPWKKLILLGLLNTAIPFTAIAAAEVYLTASLGAILNATTPIFMALLVTLFLKERQNMATIIALLIGFAGVVVIVGWQPMVWSWQLGLAILASLTGALFYGIGGLYAAHCVKGLPPLAMAIGQLTGAGLILTPFALYAMPHSLPSAETLGSLLGLGILSTGVAYLCYFNLIKLVGPSKTLTVTYLIPGFGILWGVLFLGEQVPFTSMLGLAMILLGVLILNLKK